MKIAWRILTFLFLILSHGLWAANSIWVEAGVFGVMLLLSGMALVRVIKGSAALRLSWPEFLLFLFMVYLAADNIFYETFVSNGRLLTFILFLLSYFVFSILFEEDKLLLRTFILGVIFGVAIEVFVGYGQLFGVFQNTDSKFLIGGLLGNPGALAGFLSIASSFLLVLAIDFRRYNISENIQYFIIFLLCSSIFLIIACDSRGAWVSCVVGILTALHSKYSILRFGNVFFFTTKRKVITILVSVIVLSATFYALYNYKRESAFGRLLIWKISREMVLKNPVAGSGFGYFEADYGKIQASYFLTNKGSEQEKSVADYVVCAYNEWLEMLTESGLLGLVLMAALFYFALKGNYADNFVKSGIYSILILSLVSYPFRIFPIMLFLILFFFIAFRVNKNEQRAPVKFGKLIGVIIFIMVAGISYAKGRRLCGQYYFQKGYLEVLQGNVKNGIERYKMAYKYLAEDGNFLFYYGSALNMEEDYSGSAQILRKAVALSSNPNAFIILGSALQKSKQFREAENAFLAACGITPAKLYPKHLLVKLYLEMKETQKALDLARIILTIREKIATTAGKEIKAEMNKLITGQKESL